MSDVSDKSKSFETLLRLVAAAPDVPLELDLEIGTIFAGRYRILERLGRGAMGIVFRVADEELGENVALKLLDPRLGADPTYQRSLRTEVRLARRVSHPNVCRVHDLGSEEDQLFVTMELLGSETLRPYIDQQTSLSLARRIDILVQIASGLAAAHRAGVIHGDVKPDNIILDGERAVLTDFGVASLALGAAPTFAGTPAYMAPELLTGRSADRRIDTYSFGVLAYELLAGRRPFEIDSVRAALAAADHRAPCPPLPSQVADAEVCEALDAVIRRAVALDPARRPDPVDQIASMLSRAASGEAPAPRSVAQRVVQSRERAVTAVVARLTEPIDRSETEALERPITNLGGMLVAVDGRGVEALFGAPRSRGDDAIRAARAGLALAASFPSAAVGIHTGRARLQTGEGAQTAVGPALELARELAETGGVVCSRTARAQLAGHFDLTPATKAHFTVSDRAGGGIAVVAPLCGRGAELDELESVVSQAFQERRARFVRVSGPAGIGKTRIVDELLKRMMVRRELDVVSVRAAPFADAGPLALLRQVVPDAERPEQLRQRLLERAARRPLVLVADDLQWADEASCAFLADLERMVDEAALVGIYISRDETTLWPPPESAPSSVMSIAALETDHARALVLGVAPIAEPEAVLRAVERAAGNPLLLEELGRALREGRKALPDTAVAAAQEQLDQLVELSRDVARRAAVLGNDIDRDRLAAISDGPRRETPTLEAALGDLIERGILAVRADDGGMIRYRFASPLVREVAYELTAPAERARWHAAAAHSLELAEAQGAGARVDAHAIAEHWERAGEKTRARDAYRRAGSDALARFAFAEAAASLRKAADLTDEHVVDIELLTELGLALEHSDGEAAEEHFHRAFVATRPGDPARPRLCLHLGRRAGGRSENEEARRWYERGLSEIEESDVTVRAALYANLGSLLGYILSDNQRGLQLCEQAVSLLEGTEHRRELADALSRLGGNYMRAGRWRDQLECNRRHLEIAEGLGDLAAQVGAHVNLGEVHKSLGELEQSLEHTRAALTLCARIGNSSSRALGLSNLGLLLLESGDLRGAEARLTRALEARHEDQLQPFLLRDLQWSQSHPRIVW